VFGGIESSITALVALAGPLLVTPMVYVMLFPGTTTTGEADLITERSVALESLVISKNELPLMLAAPSPAVTVVG